MRVLVTGGAGLIGSHIVEELLSRGHEPFVLDNLESGSRENLPAGVKLFEVDICDRQRLPDVFDEVRPQAVSHQAAQMSVSRSVREPVYDAEVNVLGLLNVFDQAARVGAARIVFASSGGVLYGDVFEPPDETHPSAPISPYGISKWVGEHYLRFYTRQHPLSGVALRYSNVYGPRQNPHGEAGVVAIFSERMLVGLETSIFGDGTAVRDYVFVEDVARANVDAIEASLDDGFAALNIGTGRGTDVNQLAGLIRDLCQTRWESVGRSGQVPPAQHVDPRPGELQSSLVDAAQAESVLGWSPQVDVAEGLRRAVDWFAAKVDVQPD